MSRKGREGRKRRIARSRRCRVRRHRARTYAAMCNRVYSHSFYIEGLEMIIRPTLSKWLFCRGCLYTNEDYAYCGIGVSPDIRGCSHRELINGGEL